MNARVTLPFGIEPVAHLGPAASPPRVVAEWLTGTAIFTIAPLRGQRPICAALLADTYGLTWPGTGALSIAGERIAAWNGPGDILLISRNGDLAPDQLAGTFGGKAAIVDQSSGRCAIDVSGSDAERMLMKLVEIDVHPAAFKAGMAAVTELHHMSIGLYKLAEPSRYLIHCARSYAADVWHCIAEAGSEFGIVMPVNRQG